MHTRFWLDLTRDLCFASGVPVYTNRSFLPCLALVLVCANVLLLSLAREGTLAVGSVHTV